MAIITLTTDFGTKDHSVAAVKGRILSELPEANIVDISHEVPFFNIPECAYILKNAYKNFPEGSIHIYGVDSEPSPDNEPIAILLNEHYFIGANNGVISLISEGIKPSKITKIELPKMDKGPFPLRDIFAVVACHLARGGKLELVSKPFDELKEAKDFEPRIENNGDTLIGNIIYVDNYGNVVTNISKSVFEAYRKGRSFEIIARREKLTSVHTRYNEFIDFNLPENNRRSGGKFLAIFNSSGFLELAIYKSNSKGAGSAETLVGLNHREMITVNFL
ncbi:SAM hydrolase/SAM-dependent halogenase family protein [Croceivirga thetidis]|uniref:SAM-dependent chlorinase/fluorinase n=1 Tax=Croceivirga thetidis TaxID=2721623 RepID=A0ABX1GSQ1_9FLAO|nr:SAM-dependent chlorinase/fluorinase [Croceivirga thetidis]NKI32031.1 SAM-dependent chlorinase/fluorinase [Croceivirga thetidis]